MIFKLLSVDDTSFTLLVKPLALVSHILSPHLAHTTGHPLVSKALLVAFSPEFPNKCLM
jgi:hypothetical protein